MFLLVKCLETKNEKIRWDFLDSTMPIKSLFMSYELSENEGKTRLRFTYEIFLKMLIFLPIKISVLLNI